MTAINLQLPDGAKPRTLPRERKAAPAAALVPTPAPRVFEPLEGFPSTPVASQVPVALSVNLDNIPEELKGLRRWVCWVYEKRDPSDKDYSKQPKIAGSGRNASSTNPATWVSFEQASRAYATGRYSGIGIVLDGDGLAGVDLDDCVVDGVPQPAALALLDGIGCEYVEVSPSGTGLRGLGYASNLESGKKGIVDGVNVELYTSVRYLTLTGHVLRKGPLVELPGFHAVADRVVAAKEAARATKTAPTAPTAPTYVSANERGLSWARAALDGAVSTVVSMGKGDRNNTLNNNALRMFRMVLGGLLDEHEVRERLEGAAIATGLPRAEVLATLRSAHNGAVKEGPVYAPQPEKSPQQHSSAHDDFGVSPQQQPHHAAAHTDADGVIRDPVDPFAEHPVPPFPLEVLPETFSNYAKELSAGSGFDVGAYGFSLLVLAAGMVDHRVKLDGGPFHVPPHIWGSLSASSGGGKSPVIEACAFAVRAIDRDMQRASGQRLGEWLSLDKEEQKQTPKPPMRQLVISDTTTEAAATVLSDNQEGVILVLPELSEWVGRMDAYSAGGDKDRGVWIQAYDGGPRTINRAKSVVPMFLDNFSTGMLAGIQPEKLAQMFAKSGAGGADGLFQRFLTYQMQEPGPTSYSHQMNEFIKVNVGEVFKRLNEWREGRVLKGFRLAREVIHEAEAHHNNLRKLGQRLPNGRFAEHVDKMAGLTLRVTFALHVLHAADEGFEPPSFEVPLEMFRRAQKVISVLYRHSEAAYEKLDQTGIGASVKLAKSACEAVLVRKWATFQNGDLTRYATHWEGADERHRQAALDLLIDWSWIADVTPPTEPGKRGRRSQGLFSVNPLVLERFKPHADRIKLEREERFTAIQQLAATRKG